MRKNRTITILAIVITAMLGFFSTNCKKIEPERLIIIKTGTVEEVLQTSCVLSATLLDVGGDQGVTQHGFCFSLNSNIADIAFCSEKGSKRTKGEFTDVIEGLTPGTSYHAWAYASDDGETEYGKSLTFETPPIEKPILETEGPGDITINSAHSGGNILSDGGSAITARGVCWNTSTAPNLSHSKTTDGSGPGEFGSNLAPLEPDTKYYIRAYATNSMGTGYGNELSFTTLVEPVLAELITGSIEDVTWNAAMGGGDITSDGGSSITARGVCWNTSPEPLTSHTKTSDGAGTGSFESNLTPLDPETKYYVRAYATNGVGTAYGNEQTFNTPMQPIPAQLTTYPIEEITWNSAVGGGNITSDGGSEISERGLCWSLNSNPTTANFHQASGGGVGEFNVQMTDLAAEAEYFVRAYAINDVDIAYGNEQVFSTIPVPIAPEVVTHTVSSIGHTSAWCGGTISSDGGAPIISKGLCWSATEPEPTLTDAFIEYGNNSDPFNMEIAGLDHNTEYFVRAYATNSEGTGYGDPVAFRTLFLCGSQLLDERDGRTYFTVSIGDQCWMAENLNVGVMVDTFDVPGDNGTLEKYCYNNDISNCDTYGGQYTWDEMMQYTLVEMTQGVCPAGWHIPSDLEWKIMERALGMTVEESDGTSWRGTDEGGQLKSGGTSFWNPPNTGATNTVLFSALPSGMVWTDGSSSGIGDFGLFWTSTSILETQAWYRYLHTDETRIYRVDGYRLNSTPVRCVKD